MRHQMVFGILLILYIAFAYGNPPSYLSQFLESTVGKIVALGFLLVSSLYLHAGVLMLLAIAILITIPSFEFFENKGEGSHDVTPKAPGKNIQERKAPIVDIESQLRKAPISSAVDIKAVTDRARKNIGKLSKLKPSMDSKLEHFQSCNGGM